MATMATLFTDVSLELAWPFSGWPDPVQYGMVFAVPTVIGAMLFRLSRFEMRLVSAKIALALLTLRLATVAAILGTLFFDPQYTAVRREDVPGRILIAVDTSDSMRVTDPQRPMAEKLLLAKQLNWTHDISGDREVTDWIAETSAGSAPSFADTPVGRAHRSRYDAIVKRIDDATRLALAERVLLSDGASLLDRLKSKHTVELVGADQTLVGLPTDPARLMNSLDSARPQSAPPSAHAPALTDLKLPLARAGESSGKLLAIILLTDGRHNCGDSPQQRANELAARGVPIYPVAMAPRLAPPDVSIVAAKAQASTVFKGSTVPVEVAVRVTGWPAGAITVKLELPPNDNGEVREAIVETIRHGGADETYPVVLKAKMDAAGPQTLTVTAESKAKEDRFPANNSRVVRVNVVKDRARVLLIDGEARWEFHYLHTCLGRDENMDVRSVVFRQPRVTRATDDDLRKSGIPARQMPDEPDGLNGYDCIIVGDVEPDQFGPAERARLEKYVAEAGGTVVFQAGKRSMPLSHSSGDEEPIRKLLPIKNPRSLDSKFGFPLALTAEGQRSWFLQMGDTGTESRVQWERFPPHYWAVTGEAKDAAEVLATAAGQPVLLRQNYGFGRVLYLGIDSTWRWRYKTGDTFHHRFWGQIAQWAASDRLLPTSNASGTIRFGTREPTFRPGQVVEVIVRATEDIRKLGPGSLKGARVVKLPAKPNEAERLVGLIPFTQPEARPRDLAATAKALPPGKYALELEIPEWADQLQGPAGPDGRATKLRSPFEVLSDDQEELLDLSANFPLLEELATATGGKVYTPETIGELIERLQSETATVEYRTARPFRQSWWVLGLILGLLSAEWGLRKWNGLA